MSLLRLIALFVSALVTLSAQTNFGISGCV